MGVGVVMPEPKPAGAQVAWPRAFTVEISTKSTAGAAARAVPRGAFHHTLGT